MLENLTNHRAADLDVLTSGGVNCRVDQKSKKRKCIDRDVVETVAQDDEDAMMLFKESIGRQFKSCLKPNLTTLPKFQNISV